MKRLEDMTEPELSDLLEACAKAVDEVLKAKVIPLTHRHQFVLVVFDDPKIAQYVSSCERESMIEAMSETADRLSKKQNLPR